MMAVPQVGQYMGLHVTLAYFTREYRWAGDTSTP